MTENLTPGTDTGAPIVSSAAHAITIMCVLGMVVTVRMAITGGPGLQCMVRKWAGTACPTCGLTRSIAAVWQGDLTTSWGLHPLGVFVAALMIGYLAITVPCSFSRAWQARREKVVSALLRGRTVALAVALLLGIWCLRLLSGSLIGV